MPTFSLIAYSFCLHSMQLSPYPPSTTSSLFSPFSEINDYSLYGAKQITNPMLKVTIDKKTAIGNTNPYGLTITF